MRRGPWRTAAAAVAAVTAAALVLSAQTPASGGTVTFRLYALGREVGREVSTLAAGAAGRTIESVVTFTDRGAEVRLTASVDADFDWEPRRLVLKGQPFAGGAADLEITVAGTRATVRDRGTSSTIDIGDGLFFPVDGALPAALQESLIAYWRNHGRPASIRSAPRGAMRIEVRADEQVDIGGRVVGLQRIAMDGPVWGRQTAWVEPGGNLYALSTTVDGIPFQAVRDGAESRLDRFIDRAIRERMDDLDRLTVAPERRGDFVLTGADILPLGNRRAITNGVIVVRGGRIADVGPASSVKVPGDLSAFDASGMTIVPGLWDAGARISQIELGPLYLAAGITTVRSAGPDRAFAAALRGATAENDARFLGPRVIPAGGIDAPGRAGATLAGTVDEARQAVRAYRNDGLRRIDLSRRLDPSVFRAAAAEARRLGMGLAGGVPDGMTVADATAEGLELVEGGPSGPDSAGLATLVKDRVAFAPAVAASQGVAEAVMNLLPPSLARRFELHAPAATDGAARLAALRSALDAKVTMVATSGDGVPALGLLREIEMFVEAGMAPADALQAVTSTPARLMKTEDAGVIESGKRADLVILTGNPLTDIANIRTAKWVVVDGRMYDVEKLRAIVN